ncbi:hypothetical protein HDU98_007597, partial [Podochytrium sp. JEL0797]
MRNQDQRYRSDTPGFSSSSRTGHRTVVLTPIVKGGTSSNNGSAAAILSRLGPRLQTPRRTKIPATGANKIELKTAQTMTHPSQNRTSTTTSPYNPRRRYSNQNNTNPRFEAQNKAQNAKFAKDHRPATPHPSRTLQHSLSPTTTTKKKHKRKKNNNKQHRDHLLKVHPDSIAAAKRRARAAALKAPPASEISPGTGLDLGRDAFMQLMREAGLGDRSFHIVTREDLLFGPDDNDADGEAEDSSHASPSHPHQHHYNHHVAHTQQQQHKQDHTASTTNFGYPAPSSSLIAGSSSAQLLQDSEFYYDEDPLDDIRSELSYEGDYSDDDDDTWMAGAPVAHDGADLMDEDNADEDDLDAAARPSREGGGEDEEGGEEDESGFEFDFSDLDNEIESALASMGMGQQPPRQVEEGASGSSEPRAGSGVGGGASSSDDSPTGPQMLIQVYEDGVEVLDGAIVASSAKGGGTKYRRVSPFVAAHTSKTPIQKVSTPLPVLAPHGLHDEEERDVDDDNDAM